VYQNLESYLSILSYLNSQAAEKPAFQEVSGLLFKLWEKLMPYSVLQNSGVTTQWVEIGYQDTDPTTDFR
jgi:hypothetical protein